MASKVLEEPVTTCAW